VTSQFAAQRTARSSLVIAEALDRAATALYGEQGYVARCVASASVVPAVIVASVPRDAAGSELVLSPLVDGLPTAVAFQGVVTVYADLDLSRLLPTADQIRAAISARTAAVWIADPALADAVAPLLPDGVIGIVDGWSIGRQLHPGCVGLAQIGDTGVVAIVGDPATLSAIGDVIDGETTGLPASSVRVPAAVAALALAQISSGRAIDAVLEARAELARLQASLATDDIIVRPRTLCDPNGGVVLRCGTTDLRDRSLGALRDIDVPVRPGVPAIYADSVLDELTTPTRWPFTVARDAVVGTRRIGHAALDDLATNAITIDTATAQRADVTDVLRRAAAGAAPVPLRGDIAVTALLASSASDRIRLSLPLPRRSVVDRLVALAGQRNEPGVLAPWRHHADVVRAQSLIASGGLGTVDLVELTVVVAADSSDPLAITSEQGIEDPLLDIGPAAIDLVRTIVGWDADCDVLALRRQPDATGVRASVELRANGSRAAIDLRVTTTPPSSETDAVYATIYGSEGSVRLGTYRSSYRRADRLVGLEFGTGLDIAAAQRAALGAQLVPLGRLRAVMAALDLSAERAEWVPLPR
jgi:hypothetical protein